MRRDLLINFSVDGASITQQECAGVRVGMQQCGVNIGTDAGSDPLFPTAGTALLLDALSGKLFNETLAQHSANFAALDTLYFVRQHDDESLEESERIQSIDLLVTGLGYQRVDITATFGTTNGSTSTSTNENLNYVL